MIGKRIVTSLLVAAIAVAAAMTVGVVPAHADTFSCSVLGFTGPPVKVDDNTIQIVEQSTCNLDYTTVVTQQYESGGTWHDAGGECMNASGIQRTPMFCTSIPNEYAAGSHHQVTINETATELSGDYPGGNLCSYNWRFVYPIASHLLAGGGATEFGPENESGELAKSC